MISLLMEKYFYDIMVKSAINTSSLATGFQSTLLSVKESGVNRKPLASEDVITAIIPTLFRQHYTAFK